MKGPLSSLIAVFAVAVILHAGVAPPAPPPPGAPAGLSLIADCGDDTLEVTIFVTPEPNEVISGGHFFLDFDPDVLQIDKNDIAGVFLPGDPPFDSVASYPEPDDIDNVAGTIDFFAVAAAPPGTDQPTIMAKIIFDVDAGVDECVPYDELVTWRVPPHPDDPEQTLLVLWPNAEKFVPDPLDNLGEVYFGGQDPVVGPITTTAGDECGLRVNFTTDIEMCCFEKFDVFLEYPDDLCAVATHYNWSHQPIPGGIRVTGYMEFILLDCPCDIRIRIDATDCCGRTGTRTSNTHTLGDDDPPDITITSPPLNINKKYYVYADAGGCTADVTLSATATDGCDGGIPAGNIEFIKDLNCNGMADPNEPLICVGNPCNYVFPLGQTCVVATVTDSCDNTRDEPFKVIVKNENKVQLSLTVEGIAQDCTRCIHFELFKCPGTEPDAEVDIDLVFTSVGGNGVFSGTVEIPCGDYTCITAEDKLHTLRRATSITDTGTQYTAAFPSMLLAGNYDEFAPGFYTGWIDVGDYTIWASEHMQLKQYNSAICPGSPDGCTQCDGDPGDAPLPGYPHADAVCDGRVGPNVADFTFIQINFWSAHENCPDCSPLGGPGWATRTPAENNGPLLQLSVAALEQMGQGHLAVADLNDDDWIDIVDMVMVIMQQWGISSPP